MPRTVINVAAFQAVWFALVLMAARGWPWLGLAVLGASLAWHFHSARAPGRELRLLAAAAGLGLAGETALHWSAVTGYPPQAWTGEPVPVWMVGLWVNFATTLHVSLAWLRGRFVAAALAGAAAGPLSYFGGQRLGAITLHPEPLVWITGIGLLWAIATPALVWVAEETATA